MPISVHNIKRTHNMIWKSGHIYSFKYTAWQNDPNPTIILMYAFSGNHPSTGHEWRFYQGINFTYIPRTYRRQFAERWMREWQATGGNMQFTYGRVVDDFPYLKGAVRRYFYKPSYYIQNPFEVPLEDIEDAIVSTWSKDFSKKIRTTLIHKYRDARQGVAAIKDKFFGEFGRRTER